MTPPNDPPIDLPNSRIVGSLHDAQHPAIGSDRPVQALPEDRYGIGAHFIPRLARLALDWPTHDGLVIGLFGPWGIGKTSVLNLFKNQITTQNSPERQTLFTSFNPWLYEDSAALITSFFATIAAEIGKEPEKGWTKAAAALRAMGSFLAVASKGVSVFGVTIDASAVSNAIGVGAAALQEGSGLSRELASVADLVGTGQRKFEEHKKAVEDGLLQLGAAGGRLVVAIDDVDRLDKAELVNLLRLIRTVADLPFVSIVVAMDDERVRDILSHSTSEGYGRSYLDKIIQIPIHIPLPDTATMTVEVATQLTNTFESRGMQPPAFLRFAESWYEPEELRLLRSLIRTPRDLARFINGIRMLLLAGDAPDVSPSDVILIEALRIFHPDVYSRVRRNKDFLTSTDRGDDAIARLSDRDREKRIKERSAQLEEIIQGERALPQLAADQAVRRIIHILFGDVENSSSGGERARNAADRRIRSSSSFDNYFRFAPASGMPSRREIDLAVQSLMTKAEEENTPSISAFFQALLAGRGTEIETQILQDLLQQLPTFTPKQLKFVGLGAVEAITYLPADTAYRVVSMTIDAARAIRFDHPEGWTNESQDAITREILDSVFNSSAPLSLLEDLLVTIRKKWALEEMAETYAVMYVGRANSTVENSDFFSSVENFGAGLSAIVTAERNILELGERAPVSIEQFRTNLINLATRHPEHLPKLLYLGGVESRGVRRLVTDRYPPDEAEKRLNSIFGDIQKLRPALSLFRERNLNEGTASRVVSDFESILMQTPPSQN